MNITYYCFVSVIRVQLKMHIFFSYAIFYPFSAISVKKTYLYFICAVCVCNYFFFPSDKSFGTLKFAHATLFVSLYLLPFCSAPSYAMANFIFLLTPHCFLDFPYSLIHIPSCSSNKTGLSIFPLPECFKAFLACNCSCLFTFSPTVCTTFQAAV